LLSPLQLMRPQVWEFGNIVRAAEPRIQYRRWAAVAAARFEEVFRGVWNILGLTGIFQQGKSGAYVQGAKRSSVADLCCGRLVFRGKR
jgi:hypothetical protein